MEEFMKPIGVIVSIVLIAMFLGLLLAFPVMWLWNWLIPSMFGLKIINVWEAWGIIVLCNLLFKSTSTNSKSKN